MTRLNQKRRLVFLGTPALAVPTLRALHAAGHEIELVVTRVDKKRGRGGDLSPSPVKAAALDLGLKVSHDAEDVLSSGAELGVVVAYGRLISAAILQAVPMLNLHFSLLPRWRGAAPVERALLEGDETTGVCIMGLEETLDTGPVFARLEVPIGPDATLESLRSELVTKGTELLLETLASELPEPEPQVGEPIYAAKITPETLRIDFDRPANLIERQIRLGRAWTTFRGKRLGIWSVDIDIGAEPSPALSPGQVGPEADVGTGAGSLRLLEVQPESKKRMPAQAWLNGIQPKPGELLGENDG